MNAEISETMRVTILGLGTQIPEIPAQRKFEIIVASDNPPERPTPQMSEA